MVNVEGDITTIRFWTSRTGILFANVTILNKESGELLTHHPDKDTSARLYAGVRELLTEKP